MLIWNDEFNLGGGGSSCLEFHLAAIGRPPAFRAGDGMFGRLELAGVFRERFPRMESLQAVDAAIRELWPQQMERFDSVKAFFAWFSTAVEAGLEHSYGKGLKRGRRAIARAQCTFRRAHARKPKCGFGGFFSAEKVNQRNAP